MKWVVIEQWNALAPKLDGSVVQKTRVLARTVCDHESMARLSALALQDIENASPAGGTRRYSHVEYLDLD